MASIRKSRSSSKVIPFCPLDASCSIERKAAEWIASKDSPTLPAAGYYLLFMKALGIWITDETMDTPLRVAKMFLHEFCSHQTAPPSVAKFKRKNYDQYVIEKGIEFSSLCEHHHLPFSGHVHIGYHPNEWLAGLSKLPRVVRHFASRPQLQEHLVSEIANYLNQELDPHGLIVIAQATHACMQCRGVRSNASTLTSKILGRIDKQEVFNLLKL